MARGAGPYGGAGDGLPHAAPFRFLDRVTALDGRGGSAEKLVTADDPLMGAGGGGYALARLMAIEALAQLAGLAAAAGAEDRSEGDGAYLAGLDSVRFGAPLRAGDLLRLDVAVEARLGPVVRASGRASVRGETVLRADLVMALGGPATAGGGR